MLFYSQIASALSPNGSKTLRIGMSVAFSTEEDYYATAINALYLRIQQMNDRLDLIDADTKLELYHLENDEQTSNILRAGVEFIKSDVLAIIGTGWSSLTDLLLLVTRNSQIPVCDGGSTSPMLSNKLKYPNFFRTVPQDSAQAVAIVGFIKSNGWKKISIIYSNEPYGLGLATQTETECAKNGIKILSKISYLPYSEKTVFETVLKRIKDADPRIILMYGNLPSDYFECIKMAKSMGLYGDEYVWIGPDAATSISDGLPTLDGLISFFPVEAQGKEAEDFKNYSLANRLTTDYVRLNWTTEDNSQSYQYFYASCIDLLVLGFDALLKSNSSFTLDDLLDKKLHQYLQIPKSFDFPDINTPTGKIELDQLGDRKGDYNILNYVNSKKELVGLWQNGRKIKYQDIVFIGGSTVVPSDGIVPEKVAYSISLQETFSLVALLVFLVLLLVISRWIYLDVSLLLAGEEMDSVRLLQLTSAILFNFKLVSLNGIPTVTQCTIDNVIPAFCCSLFFSLCIASHKSPIKQRTVKDSIGIESWKIVQMSLPWLMPTIAILLYWNVNDPPVPRTISAGYQSYVWVCRSSSYSLSGGMNNLLYAYNSLLLLICGIRIVKTFQMTRGQAVIDLTIICVLNAPIIAAVQLFTVSEGYPDMSLYLKGYYVSIACFVEVLIIHLAVIHFNRINSKRLSKKQMEMQLIKDNIRMGNSSYVTSTKNTLYCSKVNKKPLRGMTICMNDPQSYKSIFVQPQPYFIQLHNPTTLYMFKEHNGTLESSGMLWELQSLKIFESDLIDSLTMSINLNDKLYIFFFKDAIDVNKMVDYFDNWKDTISFSGFDGFDE
ncbi:hypothetical protein HDV02_001726 [Globomyces sp. JEL0801]|nr:hypothetical protein HDV02_001726 [Globomyces sp. JEL0801]